MAQIATLYMLCGLPGAGKTTLARRLERERGAFRLAEDDWMIRLFGSADGHGDEQRERIKAVQWEIAERILRLGGNVVLDWAFWLRSERDDYRARASALGASAELYYLDVPREELLRRLTERDLARPADSFPVTADELEIWTTMFEPPTVDEFEHR
jgi:predicted kinase